MLLGCPVRMADHPLLCFQWDDFYFLTLGYLLVVEHPQLYSTRLLMHCLGFSSVVEGYCTLFTSCFMCATDRGTCLQRMATFASIFTDIGVPISCEDGRPILSDDLSRHRN